ncbi:MAG: hypothetical protein LBD58_13610 [Treponema sp.]|jgi:hypothetical protein|nr:hypothetical protein [Treponema sp.]
MVVRLKLLGLRYWNADNYMLDSDYIRLAAMDSVKSAARDSMKPANIGAFAANLAHRVALT